MEKTTCPTCGCLCEIGGGGTTHYYIPIPLMVKDTALQAQLDKAKDDLKTNAAMLAKQHDRNMELETNLAEAKDIIAGLRDRETLHKHEMARLVEAVDGILRIHREVAEEANFTNCGCNFCEILKHALPGGCGKPGHVTATGDEGTSHCQTCGDEATKPTEIERVQQCLLNAKDTPPEIKAVVSEHWCELLTPLPTATVGKECGFDGDGVCNAMACFDSTTKCGSRDENGNPVYTALPTGGGRGDEHWFFR